MRKSLTIKLCLLLAIISLANAGAVAGPKLEQLFFSFDSSNGLADNSAQTITCTRTGRMVITTIGHVNFYDGDSFTHIDPEPENDFPLPKYNGHYHLYFDRFHHLWLKDKRSVTCVDLMTERFVVNVDSVMKSLGVKQPVDDMFGDVNSHLWMLSGSELYGVNAKKTFPVRLKEELQDVGVYNNKQLLQFFANSVVSVYDLETGRHQYDLAALEPAEASRYTNSSVIYPDSNLYYQIRNGDKEAVLLRFDIEKRQWEKLLETPYHLNNMVRHRHKLYIASEYGYWTYNIKTGETEHIEELHLSRGRTLTTDINTISFDRQGGMWLGTEKRGVLYSRPFKIPFVYYTWDEPEALEYSNILDRLPASEPLPRRVNCKYKDSRGWTWTGTYTGLYLKKPGSSKEKSFTCKDGLLNEMVHSVIEDDSNNIWIATSFGISHLYIRGDSVHHIETYTNRDNVPNESFVNGRAMKLEDGTIVMQSLDHMVVFHPSNFYEKELSRMSLYPKLIRLMVNGYFVGAGVKVEGREILDRAITRVGEFAVNYNQNTLTLTFSGLNYMRPIQTYYRVRVKGVYDDWKVLSYAKSDGWVDNRGLLHLPLTALPPGNYQIEVQASMSPDSWPEEPFVWTVNVEEPWWRTTGIYILLGSVIAILLIVNFIYSLRNARLRFMRNTKEDDLMKRILNFAERCSSMSGEVLTPFTASVDDSGEVQETLDDDFVKAMLRIVPFVNGGLRDGRVTMRQLSYMTGVDLARLYEVMSYNLYKSPRQLALKLRLQDARDLLKQKELSIEDIADKCGFVSPNYFIASFYHQYRQTPEAYRNSNAR